MSIVTNSYGLIIRKLNLFRLRKIFYPLLLLLLSGWMLRAQDIHYSQFYNAPLNQNPALTGLYRGDVRFMGNYRTQWRQVPVDYQTLSAVADMKIYPRLKENGLFAAGLAFNYDQAGLSKLQLVQIGLNSSYLHRTSEYSYLSFGLQLSAMQRGFKPDALTFDNQFNSIRGFFDPTLPTGENFTNTTNFFFDLAAGVNFRVQGANDNDLIDKLEKRNKIDVGIGFFHLNRPDQSFFEGYKSPLFLRMSPYISGTLMLGKNFDFVGNLTGQFQGPYREVLGMAGIKVHANRRVGEQLAVQLGGGYRFDNFGDAYFPNFEVFFNNWQAGFSYDVNISAFRVATNRRGGPEFSVRYIIKRPPPLFKVCPLI